MDDMQVETTSELTPLPLPPLPLPPSTDGYSFFKLITKRYIALGYFWKKSWQKPKLKFEKMFHS